MSLYMKIGRVALSVLTVGVMTWTAACGAGGRMRNSSGEANTPSASQASLQTDDDYYAQLHASWAHSQ